MVELVKAGGQDVARSLVLGSDSSACFDWVVPIQCSDADSCQVLRCFPPVRNVRVLMNRWNLPRHLPATPRILGVFCSRDLAAWAGKLWHVFHSRYEL